MIFVASHYVHDDDGRILFTHQGKRRQLEANMTTGTLVTLDNSRIIDGTKHYHKDGAIIDRPNLHIPPFGVVGVPVVVVGIPPGVDIKVNKAVVGTSDGATLELKFDLDGEYEIEINPPFPSQRSTQTIKITPERNP